MFFRSSKVTILTLLFLVGACSSAPKKILTAEEEEMENYSATEDSAGVKVKDPEGDYFPAAKIPEEKTIIVGVRSEKSLLSDEDGSPLNERELSSDFASIATKYKIFAQSIEDSGLPAPKVPFLVRWCGGEWCGFVKDFTLTHDRKLLKDADASSKLIKQLSAGETLERVAIFTKVTKLGKYKKGHQNFSVITYSGEGAWVIYEDNKLDTIEYYPNDESASLVEPTVEEWMYAETTDGKFGWIKEVNRHTLPFRPSR
ncbi:MAG: hypothetical protein ACOYL6_07045 [Bacteriovoracaceae bacterium]